MKKNKNTIIHGRKTVLVPYRRVHVNKYHGWMQSEELQELTASEPLSLEQEFRMQESWLDDEDKCTFVILDRNVYSQSNSDEIASMIGDVNLFLNDIENRQTAEVEIMVAELHARGQGMGKEALLLMMRYDIKE
ncbi:N-acetyltransferase 9-like protein isoform X2 [Lineus longissimus]|uniref:N-acetyltransferase 9-like protein isoform X2 n=1 Tax=Lineus longissimus TaxID=88925 RepID=UPI00315DCF86